MIISEKQIMLLMEYLIISLDGTLSEAGKDGVYSLIHEIRNQQSEELKDVK